jgi:carboxyl-terminal processing protease
MRPVLVLLAAATALCAQMKPEDVVTRFFDRVTGLTGKLRTIGLKPNLREAVSALPGFTAKPHAATGDLQVGAKLIAITATSWTRLESADRAWIDVVEFPTVEAAGKLPDQWRQPNTGQNYSDAFSLIALNATNGLDSTCAAAIRNRVLINVCVPIPFAVHMWMNPGNTPDELAAIDRAVGVLAHALEATVTAVKDPAYLTWIPPAEPTDETVRMRRIASLARLWSEAKYNFVFLDQRKNLDWDSMLELYLPRVMNAKSNEEYVGILKEAAALLADGHTGVQGGPATDEPALRIQPVEGRPVLTGIGDVPALKAAGLQPGMELISVDDVPAADVRKKLERIVGASTPQSRAQSVDAMLLTGAPNSSVHAVFRNATGSTVDTDFSRNAMTLPAKAFPWRKSSFEYRELPGNIAYVALNSFGSDNVVKAFDRNYEAIRKASAIIIDVRENGGGSTNFGYDIIARLIGPGTILKTSLWRTRDYKPTLRAWGNPETWHEGNHPDIASRGDNPFLGPVGVLIGPNTFSAAEDFLVPLKMSHRATLIGSPSGGSTGQPLMVPLFQCSARICTKWDRFADGTEFVGVGVQPDIAVAPTIADIANQRDAVLEKALEILKKGAI